MSPEMQDDYHKFCESQEADPLPYVLRVELAARLAQYLNADADFVTYLKDGELQAQDLATRKTYDLGEFVTYVDKDEGWVYGYDPETQKRYALFPHRPL